ncbi:MAG: hypothetical protein LBB77_10950, partial [Treponema sp.]|nr:hypothetical protein [Treponema sp.]
MRNKARWVLALAFAVLLMTAAAAWAGGNKEASSPKADVPAVMEAADKRLDAAFREDPADGMYEGDGVSLDEAIEQSAAELAAELPGGTRVAIVGFTSEHENL